MRARNEPKRWKLLQAVGVALILLSTAGCVGVLVGIGPFSLGDLVRLPPVAQRTFGGPLIAGAQVGGLLGFCLYVVGRVGEWWTR